MAIFADTLKIAMDENGMSTREMAQIFGVSHTAVAKWRTGQAEPRNSLRRVIEGFFGEKYFPDAIGVRNTRNLFPESSLGEIADAITRAAGVVTEAHEATPLKVIVAGKVNLFGMNINRNDLLLVAEEAYTEPGTYLVQTSKGTLLRKVIEADGCFRIFCDDRIFPEEKFSASDLQIKGKLLGVYGIRNYS